MTTLLVINRLNLEDQDHRTHTYTSHQNAMLEGLNSLRENGQLLDVTLMVEGRPFMAHKAVLASCSDYFKAMFTDPMLESRRDEISLNGLTKNGFEFILDYVYTAKLFLNETNVQDILSAATHLQILQVVQACSSYLQSLIDIDNCVDIANIAENYFLPQLKRKVYTFMSGNLLEFSRSKEFARLSPQQLETLLTCDCPVDCSEEDVFKIVLNWMQQLDKSSSDQFRSNHLKRILRRVHFKDIPRHRVDAILEKTFPVRDRDKSLYKLVTREAHNPNNLCQSNLSSHLLNRRGMEMALLKIGGFGISGLTNDITYSLTMSGSWHHLTSIPHVEQCNFGTAVLNNELYIVGGCFNQSLQEIIHPFGFKYSPRLNKWSTMAPMKTERCRFSLNVVGKHLYAIGGASEVETLDGGNEGTNSCERYDPSTDLWQNIASLREFRTRHAGASYSEFLYISGGLDRDTVLSSVSCYVASSDTWRACANMLRPRADHVMLNIGNFLYVCGGWREDPVTRARILVDTIDTYDISKDRWEMMTRVPTPRYHAGIVAMGRKIYFIGGFHSDATFDRDSAAIECYDIDKNLWVTGDKYPQVVWEHCCATLYVPKCRDDMEVISY